MILLIAIVVLFTQVLYAEQNGPRIHLNEVVSNSKMHSHRCIVNPNRLPGLFNDGSVLVLGANIGRTRNDHSWHLLASPSFIKFKKIFVEPIRTLYEELQRNIDHPRRGCANATAVNAAIAETSGEMTMYCIGLHSNGTMTAAAWLKQTCSLFKERLWHQNDIGTVYTRSEIEQQVVEHPVSAYSITDLLAKYAVGDVRMIQIDVEGFDYQVSESVILLLIIIIVLVCKFLL